MNSKRLSRAQTILTIITPVVVFAAAQAWCTPQDSLTSAKTPSAALTAADTLIKHGSLSAHDSAATQMADSTGRNAAIPSGDSLTKKIAPPKKAAAPEDSASLYLKTPGIGFGIGWEIGSVDVFSDWQSNLPDSVGQIMPLNPDTFAMSIAEQVNSYNVLFPLSVSWTPLVNRKSSFSLEASFCYIGKSLQATLKHDTASGKIDYRQALDSYTFNLGALYRYGLDERYFRIEGVDRTSLIIGAYVVPYSYLAKQSSVSGSGVADSVLIAAKSTLQNFWAWGMGAGWRVGISTQRALSKNSGMEVSICYVGRYLGFFREKQGYVLNEDVNPSKSEPDNKLSFFSNTVEMKVEFMLCTPEKNKSQK